MIYTQYYENKKTLYYNREDKKVPKMTVKIITKIVIEIRWGDTPTSPNKG